MKRNILYLLMLAILVSCATKKPSKRSRMMKGFYTQYNTLFNAKDALNTEFKGRSEAFKDNFYAPYIPLLTYEDQPLGSEIGQTPAFNNLDATGNTDFAPKGFALGPPNTAGNNGKGASVLEIAEAKALKAIEKYSVTRDGQEKNDKIFDAHIILAQSRIYMGKPMAALDALNYLFTSMRNDKRLPLAKVYQGQAYAAMGDYVKANQIFIELKEKDLKKDHEKLLDLYYAESLLKSGKKNEAVQALESAFSTNSNRKLKSRIAFLRGQILAEQGKPAEARESFMTAYKFANDFEFEVKSQVEIAKTYNSASDYQGARDYLEKISKKGTYASRKNEFYYALGLMANKAGKKEDADMFFRKSLAEKVSDPQIRGLSYYEIGKSYLAKDDYIVGGAYYDSAVTVMTYEPTKVLLAEQSQYIKKLAKNYYLVKKNDSILALARMDPAQRNTFFTNYIAKIKAKEDAAERERLREERSKGFDTGDYNANSLFANNKGSFQDFGGSTKGFYFSNNNTVSKGESEFKQIWGNRALADNWRYTGKMASVQDAASIAMGQSTAPNPRRFEPSFYIEQIPTNPSQLENLKKDRDTAALGMGIMYDDYFVNRPLATKTLYALVDNKPEEKVMLQALYEIFSMNYEENPSQAARAKEILLRDYPYTSYAEFARNPRNGSFVKSAPEAENAYKTAFALYEAERFEESSKMVDQAIQQYSKDALVPKFALLNAFIAGKTTGKEVMILQLEQIALNYEKTPEGEKAKQMLNYLKSDLQIQMTDQQGNAIQNQQKPQNNVPPNSGQNLFGTPAEGVPQQAPNQKLQPAQKGQQTDATNPFSPPQKPKRTNTK